MVLGFEVDGQGEACGINQKDIVFKLSGSMSSENWMRKLLSKGMPRSPFRGSGNVHHEAIVP